MKAYYAVWHHRHGDDVIVNATPEGRLRDVCNTVVMPYLDEMNDSKIAKKIEKFAHMKDYNKALELWGVVQEKWREEYVEFGETEMGP